VASVSICFSIAWQIEDARNSLANSSTIEYRM
jgi:hypothetical protein